MPKKKYTKQKSGLYRASVFSGEYNPETGLPIKKYFSARTVTELDKKVEAYRARLKGGMNYPPAFWDTAHRI